MSDHDAAGDPIARLRDILELADRRQSQYRSDGYTQLADAISNFCIRDSARCCGRRAPGGTSPRTRHVHAARPARQR